MGQVSAVRQLEQPVRILMRGLDSWLQGHQPQRFGVSVGLGSGRGEGASSGDGVRGAGSLHCLNGKSQPVTYER